MAEKITQGQILKAWRKSLNWTLERAAGEIEDMATKMGVPAKSKQVPRRYPSLIRWENDKVGFNQLGMTVIAMAYGTTPELLRRSPKADAEEAEAIAEFLRSRREG